MALERLYIAGEDNNEIELVIVKRFEANDKKYIIFYATNDPQVGNDLQAATLVPTENGTEAFGEIETQEEMDLINEVLNDLVESGEFVPEEGQGHDHDHDHHDHEHLYAEDEDGNEIVFAVERRLEINGKQYIVYYDESEAQPRMQVSELVETADGTELFDVETDEEMALIDEALHNDDEE
ncbi:DUF1292 domain-containing protein [Kurthia massiliensis]|uniref:DUF1292 domain-containing protein n=1 Tax=Kurthia massiliensis TaxID=1033739 RepID=UPI0002882242|nr:DUF1292 domain-containing protein [Kurthia massiliensis]